MADETPQLGTVRVMVQRHLEGEEMVRFDAVCASNEDALVVARDQLALCRAHMIAVNEDVLKVHQDKARELDRAIEEKGAEVTRLNSQLEALKGQTKREEKRLRSA